MSQTLFYRFISLKFRFMEDSTKTKKRAEMDYQCKGLGATDLNLLIFKRIKNATEGIALTELYFEKKCLSTPNNLFLFYFCLITPILLKGIDNMLTQLGSLLDHNSKKDHFAPISFPETLYC